MLKHYVLFLLLTSAPINTNSQTILSQIDSLYLTNKNELSFCYSLISIDPERNLNGYEKYHLNLAQSIAYFILFENYEDRQYKIQILEKGIDRLKTSVTLAPIESTRKTIKELYNDLFNQYYSYKSPGNSGAVNVSKTIKQYFIEAKNDEIINWFTNKFWSNKCSEN